VSNVKNIHESCNFCGKGKESVEKLIQGGDVYICNGCVEVCSDILKDEKNKKQGKEPTVLNPAKIKDYLDEYIIGQDDAKMALCVAVSQHFKRIKNPSKEIQLEKTNCILLGPTGVGKTMMARKIAEYMDIPFAICDATSITEAGYVGDDVESILTRLINAADGDIDKASRGIVYIDEIDKLARKSENSSTTRDVGGEGVQQALLKMVEGSIMRVPTSGKRKHPGGDMQEIDTREILFICGGAFVGLDKIVGQRIDGRSIGFHSSNKVVEKAQENVGELYQRVMPKDLVQFGFIPEFIGRFGIITHVNELTTEELVRVLKEPKNSIIKQYQYLFELDGIKLTFEDKCLEDVAEKVKELKTNARGLKSVLEKILIPYEFDAVNLVERGLTEIVINSSSVNGDPAILIFDKKAKNEQ